MLQLFILKTFNRPRCDIHLLDSYPLITTLILVKKIVRLQLCCERLKADVFPVKGFSLLGISELLNLLKKKELRQFIWDPSGTRIIGMMRVSVPLGAVLVLDYLGFYGGFSAVSSILAGIYSFREEGPLKSKTHEIL